MKLLLSLLYLLLLSIWLYNIADSRYIKIPVTHNTAVEEWKELWEYRLSRYYSITADQTDKLPYEKDMKSMILMNCWKWWVEWCKTTADNHVLVESDIGTLYSCPTSIPLGTKIKLEFHRWTTMWVCHDRGGSIKGKRLDSFCWFWDKWVENIRSGKGCYTGRARIRVEK